MAPAPAAASGPAPDAILSSLISVLDEPHTTAGLNKGVGNNVVPGGGDDGGLDGFLTSALPEIFGGGAQTTTTSSKSTTSAKTTTTSAKALSTTSTSSSSKTTSKSASTTSSTSHASSSSTSTTSSSSIHFVTAAPTSAPATSSTPTSTSSASSAAASNVLGNSNAATGATSTTGLSQPAMIGIIVGAAAVGIFIFLFILRKIFLARRRRERVAWEAGLADYNSPKRAGASEKVEAEVARRLNANVTAPMPPLPAARARQPAPPRSPTSNMTRGPTAEMVRPVHTRGPLPPPIATNMIGPYPVFAPTVAPINAPTIGPPPQQSRSMNRMSATTMPPTASSYAVTPPPPSLSPAQAFFKTVLTTYSPQLPDELPLSIGERVRVIEVFEDGWAMVERVGPGPRGGMLEKGVVPAECLGLSPEQR